VLYEDLHPWKRYVDDTILNSYWTRSNPLSKNIGRAGKILDEASADFNIIFL